VIDQDPDRGPGRPTPRVTPCHAGSVDGIEYKYIGGAGARDQTTEREEFPRLVGGKNKKQSLQAHRQAHRHTETPSSSCPAMAHYGRASDVDPLHGHDTYRKVRSSDSLPSSRILDTALAPPFVASKRSLPAVAHCRSEN